MRQGLVRSTHDSETDVQIILLHDRRNDRVKRPLARRKCIRGCLIEAEATAAIVQHEARAATDPTVNRSVLTTVRLRNDALTGACPA